MIMGKYIVAIVLLVIIGKPGQDITSFEKAVNIIPPKYGVGRDVVQVLLDKESWGGDMGASRFEPGLMKRARKVARSEKHAKNIATSWCAFQIVPLFWTEPDGVHWTELQDPEVCTEYAMRIWSSCRERRCKGLRHGSIECVAKVAKCYNGGEPYARDFVKRLKELRGV